MKLKKKSGLIGAIIALSAASIVSVGFASWVISQGDSKTIAGEIDVDYKVEDNSHFITFVSGGSLSGSTYTLSNNILFGISDADVATYTGSPWLTNDGKLNGTGAAGSSTSVLTASFVFSVSNAFAEDSDALSIASSNVSATGFAASDSAKFEAVLNSKRIVADPVITFSDYTRTNTSTRDGQCTCTITFAYGAYFSPYVGPYGYFNNTYATATSAAIAEVNSVMDVLEDINGLTYSFTLVVAA